jgi:PHD/YefM family antitoxin component YafN of YafNO toxin-antitoxin module
LGLNDAQREVRRRRWPAEPYTRRAAGAGVEEGTGVEPRQLRRLDIDAPTPSVFAGQALAAEERIFRHPGGDELSRFLCEAEDEEIVITRNGKQAGVLIGFASEDDWFDYQLENDPRFLRRIEQARKSLCEGRGVRVEDVEPQPES